MKAIKNLISRKLNINFRVDTFNMFESILLFPKQIRFVFNDDQFYSFKNKLKKTNIDKVIVMGMGSSLIAFKIIQGMVGDKFKKQTGFVNSYELPQWVDNKTLVISSSYSGKSRETIEMTKQAKTNKSKLILITSGGELLKKFQKKSLFNYVINKEKKFNPSQQPRLAIGHSFAAFFKIITEIGLIDIKEKNILEGLEKTEMQFYNILFYKELLEKAMFILNKRVDIVSSGFLSGNNELFAKQLNWNAKMESNSHLVPEANHHIPESFIFPLSQRINRRVIIVNSDLFSGEERKGITAFIGFLKSRLISYKVIKLSGKTKEEQVLKMIVISSLISFFTSLLNNNNPTPTEGIKFIKNYKFYK